MHFSEKPALNYLPLCWTAHLHVLLPSETALKKEFLEIYFNQMDWGFPYPIGATQGRPSQRLYYDQSGQCLLDQTARIRVLICMRKDQSGIRHGDFCLYISLFHAGLGIYFLFPWKTEDCCISPVKTLKVSLWCTTIELFALSNLSFFTSCWPWIGANNGWLTNLIEVSFVVSYVGNIGW